MLNPAAPARGRAPGPPRRHRHGLLRRSGHLAGGRLRRDGRRRYRPDLATDEPGLDAIAQELGDLPLALHLAGSYLRTYRAEVTLDGYLAVLRRAEIVRHASLLGAGPDDSPSPTHHVQSVAQTFALCLSRLDREREVDCVAIALLARMACMAPGEPVPRDLLAKTLEDADPLRRTDGIRRLGAAWRGNRPCSAWNWRTASRAWSRAAGSMQPFMMRTSLPGGQLAACATNANSVVLPGA